MPMSRRVSIHNKAFKPYLSQKKISSAVKLVAAQINKELKNENPLFLAVLNGSFVFAADLLREITIPCEITFVKLASYEGTSSKGRVTELIGLNEQVAGRTVVIIEDIVDSGLTVEKLTKLLKQKKAKRVKIATALFKPAAYKRKLRIDYIGVEIANDFVVGYGLDYNGYGRNLKQIYILA